MPRRLPALCLLLSLVAPARGAPVRPEAPTPKTAGQPRATRTAPLDIRAAHLELDQARGHLAFRGAVRARQPGFALRCEALTAVLDAAGEVAEMVATGGVELVAGELVATAGRAHYRAAEGVVELTESPTVTRGGDRLRGARVRVWPQTGRVVAEQVSGTLLAPDLSGLGRLPGGRPGATPPSTP